MRSAPTFESRKLAAEYERIFNQDLKNSIELDYAKFKKQNLMTRARICRGFFYPFS